jgi:hypothetical protein
VKQKKKETPLLRVSNSFVMKLVLNRHVSNEGKSTPT